LLGVRYKLVYRRGAENSVADALSRRRHIEELLAISFPSHSWLSQLIEWYPIDAEASKLLAHLALNPESHPPYSLHQCVILTRITSGLAPTQLSRQRSPWLYMIAWLADIQAHRQHIRRSSNCFTGHL
jgi:hypothetical protein